MCQKKKQNGPWQPLQRHTHFPSNGDAPVHWNVMPANEYVRNTYQTGMHAKVCSPVHNWEY